MSHYKKLNILDIHKYDNMITVILLRGIGLSPINFLTFIIFSIVSYKFYMIYRIKESPKSNKVIALLLYAVCIISLGLIVVFS